jgi:hypothetical protein
MFSSVVVLYVNVLRHVGSHGVVGKLDAFLVVLIDTCGASQLLVDILHELTEMQSALPCAVDCYVLRLLCGGRVITSCCL